MSAPIRHIAEFNIGILRHGWDDPRIADFVNGLDRVNALAHRSPGFVRMARLDHLAEHGPTDHAFGWDAVKAQGWQAHRCGEAA
ncbi:DUF3291 domain-containing protein [Pseudooceanicola sp.]|uniref:DUF3291 domain-containing protein n=1 Tax=Pseudooceanicola sp. TaxID=1914328 RepID=UPI00351839F1